MLRKYGKLRKKIVNKIVCIAEKFSWLHPPSFPSTPSVMSTLPILDPEAIANLRALSPDDSDAFLKEILSIYLDDTPNRLAELRASRDRGDVVSFTRAAHSIKGSSSNVGAAELRAIAEKLENYAKLHGIAGSETLQAEIEAAFTRVEVELRKLFT